MEYIKVYSIFHETNSSILKGTNLINKPYSNQKVTLNGQASSKYSSYSLPPSCNYGSWKASSEATTPINLSRLHEVICTDWMVYIVLKLFDVTVRNIGVIIVLIQFKMDRPRTTNGPPNEPRSKNNIKNK